MTMNIDDILRSVSDIIMERGEDYYHGGNIESVVLSPDGVFTAEVSGSNGETYEVKIIADKDGNIEDFSCTCPYEFGDVCKHLVAVFLAIQNGDYKKSRKHSSEKVQNLPDLVKDISGEQIKSFVLEYAQSDEQFRNELLIAFGKPDLDAEMAQIKEAVRAAIRKGTHSGYIDYGGCDFICGEFMDILSTAEKRLTQGQAVIAFHIALHILLTSVKLASTADSSSGYLTEVIVSSLEMADKACASAETGGSDADRKTLYEKLTKEAKNKVFDGWGEWNYDLLRSAARFVTEKNKKKLYDSLDYLLNLYGKEKYMSHYIIDDKLTRLAIIRKLEGDGCAGEYVKENLHLDEFRRIAVQSAISDENYDYAERLCREKLEGVEQRNPYARPPEWYYHLYNIYEKSENCGRQIETAETLLLLGDMEYYDILKELLIKDGVWEKRYPEIRRKCSDNLSYHAYMYILEKECEWRLLFEETEKHPEMVFTYGKQLAEHYPDAVYAVYRAQIMEQASKSSDRKKYKKVCGSIKALYEAEGTEIAMNLIDEFSQSHIRRPAMLEELANLKKKLHKARK